MQPGWQAANPPAGFIERHAPRRPQLLPQSVVDWATAATRTQDRLGRPAARQSNAEQRLQTVPHFAVRQSGMLIQFHQGGLQIRSQLSGCRPHGLGSLQRMSPVQPLAAARAAAAVNRKPAVDRPAWNLGLILKGDAGLRDRATASRTSVRQRSVMLFVDLLRRGRLTIGANSVVVARLAAGLFRVGLRRLLRERRRLAFAGTSRFFQQTGQLLDLLRQGLHLGFQFGNPPFEDWTSWTKRRFHAASLAKRRLPSCASLTERR